MPAISDEARERIVAAFEGAGSIRDAAKKAGVGFDTAKRYAPPEFLAARGHTLKPETATLPIGKIRMDGGTQPRVAIRDETVVDYAELMAEGEDFDPPTVYHDGVTYWLADGFHRVLAALRAGLTQIECEVRKGTQRDAVLYSLGANARHGLPRSNADKRHAVTTMMRDPEWGDPEKYSNRDVARICGVTHALTNAVRRELHPPKVEAPSTPTPTPSANGHAANGSVGKPGDPPDVAALRAKGLIPADVDVEVTEPEPKVEAPSTPGADDDEPTDAEYLESLLARPNLADHVRKRFDVEALLFRRVTEHRLEYARKCKPLTNAAKGEMRGHIGPWMSRHFSYLRRNDPSRWTACRDCSGTGQVPLIGNCAACEGEGYHV